MMAWLLIIPFLLYLAFFIIALKNIPSEKFTASKSGNQTDIAVIIPCRNEEENITHILESIAVQNYPSGSFEVIVVDDNSTDATFEVASDFTGIERYRVLRNKGTGKKQAILAGVEASSAELIITTDADCRPLPSWLSSFSTIYEAEKPSMIIGPVKLDCGKGLFNIFQQAEWLGLQGITAGLAQAGKAVLCNGANLGIKRELFLKYYGQIYEKIPSGDDVFLLHAVKSHLNNKIVWLSASDGMVVTPAAGSLYKLLRQRARWISKAGAYRDILTILLSVTVFTTVFALGFLTVASLFDLRFLPMFLVCFILKNVADIPLIHKMGRFYGQKPFTGLIIPLQLLYPFYGVGILFFLLPGQQGWKK